MPRKKNKVYKIMKRKRNKIGYQFVKNNSTTLNDETSELRIGQRKWRFRDLEDDVKGTSSRIIECRI